jgi:hypothetical protein
MRDAKLPGWIRQNSVQKVRMLRRALFTLLLLTALDIERALACTCAGPLAPCAQAWRVDAVFAGRVLDIRPSDVRGEQIVRLAVEQRGRGVDADIVDVRSPPQNGANCGYTFAAGERYVVYGHRTPSGLTTNMCAGTKRAAEAAADLAYLSELAGPPRGVRIFGTVRRIEYDLVTFDQRDYGPVAGTVVRIAGKQTSRSVTTGAGGQFDVRDLPLGTYTVSMSFPRGIAFQGPPLPPRDHQPHPWTVSLMNPSQCVEFRARPHTDSLVSGVLLTSDGRPAAGEYVILIAAANADRASPPIPHVSVRTGVDGRFTFAFMPPGRYLIGLHLNVPRPGSPLDRRSYHPGVTAPAEASVVTVAPGSRIELMPFTMPTWPRLRTITGTVKWSDGVAAPNATLLITGVTRERVVLDKAGRFRLTLPYGELFSLRASATRAVDGGPISARSPDHYIELDQRDGEVSIVLPLPPLQR